MVDGLSAGERERKPAIFSLDIIFLARY